MRSIAFIATILAAWASACVHNRETPLEELDRDLFECKVAPVLLRSCAFSRCHADPGRPFRLAHPHLMRYNSEGTPLGSAARTAALRGLADHEREQNYSAALAMLTELPGHDLPLLLAKPLAEESQGAFHGGREIFGGDDVFTSVHEPDFVWLRDWASGMRMQDVPGFVAECQP